MSFRRFKIIALLLGSLTSLMVLFTNCSKPSSVVSEVMSSASGSDSDPGAGSGNSAPNPPSTTIPNLPNISGNEYAKGVPHPSNAFGWDPLTYDKAVTRTVATVPSTIQAGESVLVTGNGGSGSSNITVTFNCTQAAPCILKSNGTAFSRGLRLQGQHFIVEGFNFRFEGGNSITVNSASFGVVRNCEHAGTNTSTSNGTSMTSSFANNIVFYKNHIHNIAVYDGTDEVDYIGFVVRNDAYRFWYLENNVYNLGADSIRTGTNVTHLAAGHTVAEQIYIAKNTFRDNGENPIDLKYSHHIVISENILGEAAQSVSDTGTAIALHESADQVTILDNRIYQVNRGIATTTSGGGAKYIKVEGNTFEDITEYGVYNRGGGQADVFNNTFINVVTPIRNNNDNGSTLTQQGNVFQ